MLVFLALPRVQASAHLTWTFVGVTAFLLAWHAVLGLSAKVRGTPLRIELVRPLPTHVVQACVQLALVCVVGLVLA